MKIKVTLEGLPLKYVFISHFELFRWPQMEYFITDNEGYALLGGVADSSTITIYAQNTAVRLLDGRNLIPWEITTNFEDVSDGDTLNIHQDYQRVDDFKIMDACYDVYSTVFQQFSPFNSSNRREFPYGQEDTVAETKNQLPRIECRYPDVFFAPDLAWVEPHGLTTGYPVMHIADKSKDSRLFGVGASIASLIPHEYGHTIHMAQMSQQQRVRTEVKYALWITERLATGQPPTHDTSVVTNPFVAFIESFAIFSERFYFFKKTVKLELSQDALHDAFIHDELSNTPTLCQSPFNKEHIGVLNPDLSITPYLLGGNIEGAIYGALFLDLARRIELETVINIFLKSKASDFKEFKEFIIDSNNKEHINNINLVTDVWGM